MIAHARAAAAEVIGTGLLLLAVAGSGIMAQRLCEGNVGLALLANALATGGALIALIHAFGSISGAHFNPAVTLAAAVRERDWSRVVPYVIAQTAGAIAGVALANVLFGLPAFALSQHARTGPIMALSEFVATFGLLAVIFGCGRTSPAAAPYSVAAYIVSVLVHALDVVRESGGDDRPFAHRHVRGHSPDGIVAFVVAELLGAAAATALFLWFEENAVERSAVTHTEAA